MVAASTPMIIWQNTMVSHVFFVQKWDPPKYSALKHQCPGQQTGPPIQSNIRLFSLHFLAGEIHISRQTQISYCWLWLWFLATTWQSRLAAYEVLCMFGWSKTHRPEKTSWHSWAWHWVRGIDRPEPGMLGICSKL